MRKNQIPMLTFYRDQKTSPVRQNIDDLKKHFERRQSLFWHLGLFPLAFNNRSIIEVGPGGGHNSLYTASLLPTRYSMVEGNPTGVNDIEENFKNYPDYAGLINIYPVELAMYLSQTPERHDVVWCENVLGGATFPKEMLMQLASLVNNGGLLVVTALDEVSTLAESIRRVLAYAVLGGSPAPENVMAAAKVLEPILIPHLKTLKGMSRFYHDWIIDNICLPLSGGYNILSIPDMIETIGDNFTFHSSSPRFTRDWSWYKDLTDVRANPNPHIKKEYYENLHSFLDFRFHHAPRASEKNQKLSLICKSIRGEILALEEKWSSKGLENINRLLGEIADDVQTFGPETAVALREAREIMPEVNKNPELLAKALKLAPWFGRNQQHVSFVKRVET
jgi:hypothetical protein